jgi:hypothetical protein
MKKKKKESGRMKFYKGVFSLSWAELKTMNFEKIRSLMKVAVGYFFMKLAQRRKENQKAVPST